MHMDLIESIYHHLTYSILYGYITIYIHINIATVSMITSLSIHIYTTPSSLSSQPLHGARNFASTADAATRKSQICPPAPRTRSPAENPEMLGIASLWKGCNLKEKDQDEHHEAIMRISDISSSPIPLSRPLRSLLLESENLSGPWS